jgi:hypothetical protein
MAEEYAEFEAVDLQERSHAPMVVAATLTAAICSNRPAAFASPNAVYNAYVKIFQRVKAQDVNPTAIGAGDDLLLQ